MAGEIPTQPSGFWRFRPTEKRIILILGDFITAILALILSLWFWAEKDAWLDFSFRFLLERPPFWFYLMPFIWMILLIELHDIRRASRINETISGIVIASISSIFLYLIVYFTSEPNSLPRRGVGFFIISTTVLTFIWRLIYIQVFNAPELMRRTLIIGAGRTGSAFTEILSKMHPLPFILVGLVDDNPLKIKTQISGYPILGPGIDLLSIIQKYMVTDLILAISGDINPVLFQNLLQAEENGVEVTTLPIMYEELLGRVPISLLRSDWIIRSFVDQIHTGKLFEFTKRLIDIIAGLVLAVCFVILFPLIAILVIIDSGFPILYLQERLGKFGKKYTIYKFRTMKNHTDKDSFQPTVEHDNRITRVGNLLRKTHADELPQFINILKGEMSLVGPRAERLELVNQLQNQVPFYRARLLVKPGLTGWAQVNQRYASNVEETKTKLEYDLYYIKHRNLLLDFIIMFRTVGTVLGFKGL